MLSEMSNYSQDEEIKTWRQKYENIDQAVKIVFITDFAIILAASLVTSFIVIVKRK